MTELFEFAKTTKEIKEQIRTAINARGIEVDESIPFSVYPQKTFPTWQSSFQRMPVTSQ